MKKLLRFFLVLLLPLGWLMSCNDNPQPEEEPIVEQDTLTVLQHIQERGRLVAVTNCEIINYNTEKPTPSGFEYELLSDFCNANGLELEMIVNENLDSCFALLDSCRVDMVAVGIGSNKDMKRRYLLTDPILMQKSVLVQRLPKDWNKMSTANEVENQLLRSSVDLAGKTVHLPQGSHEVKLLEHLSDQIGDTIYIVECDSLNSFDLVKAVETGEIDYTVVEEYVARMASIGLKGLDTKLNVSVEQPLGWAVQNHDNDSSLLMALRSTKAMCSAPASPRKASSRVSTASSRKPPKTLAGTGACWPRSSIKSRISDLTLRVRKALSASCSLCRSSWKSTRSDTTLPQRSNSKLAENSSNTSASAWKTRWPTAPKG